jgi:heme-degrading monooxygenase HmoA
MTKKLGETHDRINAMQQLQDDDGPVVLFNQIHVATEDADRLLEVWADDAAFMKQQPGFISTQLHRGTGESPTFMNMAVWESARALGNAFRSPEFKERAARYPDSAVAAPQVFKKLAVPGICTG